MPDQASHYLRLALQTSEAHGWRRPYAETAAAITPVLEDRTTSYLIAR